MKASLLIAVAGVLYGFSGYLGMLGLQNNVPVNTMLFFRFAIASIWIAFFIPKQVFMRVRQLRVLDILSICLLCGFGYATSMLTYFLASEAIGTGLAKVIYFSYPIWVAIGAWMYYRKPVTPTTVGILITMVVGMLLLKNASEDSVFNIWGLIWGLGSAITWAVYMLSAQRYASKELNGALVAFLICLGALFAFGIGMIATHTAYVPNSPSVWVNLLLQGLLTTAIPIQLSLLGLKFISSLRASILSVTEPIVTILVGVFLLQESISLVQSIGILVLIGSALLIQFQKDV